MFWSPTPTARSTSCLTGSGPVAASKEDVAIGEALGDLVELVDGDGATGLPPLCGALADVLPARDCAGAQQKARKQRSQTVRAGLRRSLVKRRRVLHRVTPLRGPSSRR